MADSDTLQKIGLVGVLAFAAVAGALYYQATQEPMPEAPVPATFDREIPAPTTDTLQPKEAAGTIPVGVLGMMQAPRVVPEAGMKGVEAGLLSVKADLDACYSTPAADGQADGTLYVKLHTTAEGTTRDVQLAFRGPSGKVLHDCASAALLGMTVDGVKADTLVSWPLRWGRSSGLRLR